MTPLRKCTEPGCKIPEPHEAHNKRYDVSAHLDRVKGIIGERGATRDKPGGERSMARAVRIFNAKTGRDLSAAEGWVFMMSLKESRMSTGKYKADDYDDLTGYSALLAEEARAENEAQQAYRRRVEERRNVADIVAGKHNKKSCRVCRAIKRGAEEARREHEKQNAK